MAYDQLRVLSYRLRPEFGPLRYWCLGFPETWKARLLELERQRNRRDARAATFRIDTLNRALRALVPDIIALEPGAAKAGADGWILARNELDLGALAQITRTWVKAWYGEVSGVDGVLAMIRPEDLCGRFEESAVEFLQTPGGTAKPKNPSIFHVVPNELAARLAAGGRWNHSEHEPRDLVRVVGGASTKGAEVMSWPPYVFRDGRGTPWHYSTVLRFTLQTIPFDPEPVVNLEVVLRRWAGAGRRGTVHLPKDQKCTVYIRPRVHWLGPSVRPECFQVAPIRWGRPRDKVFPFEWGDPLGPIIEELSLQGFPSADLLRTDPTTALMGDTAAALVFDSGMDPNHRVRPGWMPGDRKPMFEEVTERLAASLVPEPLRNREEPSGIPRRAQGSRAVAAAEDATADADQTRRREEIARIVSGELHLDLLHQTTDTLLALRNALDDLIGVQAEDRGDCYRWTFEHCAIVAHLRRLGPLGDRLHVVGSGEAELRQAIADRADQVREALQQPPRPGALVELQGREAFTSGDPKTALRKGAATAGRVTQFLTPPTPSTDAPEDDEPSVGSLPHRARAAWLDLFRQLGAGATGLNYFPRESAPPGVLQYVGIWFVNNQDQRDRPGVRFPVMVRMTADGKQPQACVGSADFDGWMPYPKALAWLAAQPTIEFHQRGGDTVAQFIRSTLERDLLGGGPVLLLASAQNLRDSWRWLQNGELVIDQLRLPPGDARPISRWPGLRFIRVREGDSETPECFAESATSFGFSKGLWRHSQRVFMSTGNKPDAAKSLSPQLSRLRPFKTRLGEREPAPKQSAWNPACVEITAAALQDGDEPVVWANIVHQLRFAAWHFHDPLQLPLPLHLAKQMEEYALPLQRAR